MERLFKLQEELQLSYDRVGHINTGHLCNDIRDMAFFLNQEVVELIEEIGGKDINKPWKKDYHNLHNSDVVITDKVRSEAIDMLKFSMNICLMAGITPENVNEEFDKVHDKNITRLENGY